MAFYREELIEGLYTLFNLTVESSMHHSNDHVQLRTLYTMKENAPIRSVANCTDLYWCENQGCSANTLAALFLNLVSNSYLASLYGTQNKCI